MNEQQNDSKKVELEIATLDLSIKQAIGNSSLNVSIVELVLRNIYNEVSQLAEQNLKNVMSGLEEQKQKEVDDGNTNAAG